MQPARHLNATGIQTKGMPSVPGILGTGFNGHTGAKDVLDEKVQVADCYLEATSSP